MITFLKILFMIFMSLFDDVLIKNEAPQVVFAVIVGGILGSSDFAFSCLIPLKLVLYIFVQFLHIGQRDN